MNVAIELPMNEIVTMYVDKGYSAYRIAEMYKVNAKTILNRLHDLSVATRPSGFQKKVYVLPRWVNRNLRDFGNCFISGKVYNNCKEELKMLGVKRAKALENGFIVYTY